MKILFFANTDWYLYNFRLPLAKALQEKNIEVVLVSPPGEYAERLIDEGFSWRSVPMHRRSLNPIAEARLVWRLIKLYQSERPLLSHQFTLKCVIYGTLTSMITGVKGCINAITGLGFIFSSQSRLARILRPILIVVLKIILGCNSSRLILQNATDSEIIVRKRIICSKRIRLIKGSGVNTAQFRPLWHEKNASTDNFKVLMSTRLIWEKGVKEYLEAAYLLRIKMALPIRFYVAGKPDPGNPNSVPFEIITQSVEKGLIEYLGHVDNMPDLLNEMDCITLPTFYGEGVPRILIEAASCGLPIVASESPGCMEIVKHGINGLLVQARNSEALADAIKYLMENPYEKKRMGDEGRKIAIKEFDEEKVIEETINVYKELLPL